MVHLNALSLSFSPVTFALAMLVFHPHSSEHAMNPFEPFQQLSEQLMQRMPEPMRQLSEQAQTQVKETMAQGLASLDLVSRDEFEAQTQLLARADARIAELEARLSALDSTPDA
ncbi:accessory factor UbiK family protein [Litorivicinus lipolyticus]|uniref:Accessory factor UbiK family protein n=2 Tax=Litorivicinus lipolyticus TaxID=418701 RepID=A0A5Q2QBE4_9GAMM|nr:accessory factor UbiK family protein [Litorivicinus lipolyticus]